MRGQKELYDKLDELGIKYRYREHPAVATIAEATVYWKDIDSGRCKNIFLRNHKGNRHYLVILEHLCNLNIKDLEQKLGQGKLSFASEKRLMKYLGLKPGSVSPFGLINDTEKHVHLFIDKKLLAFDNLSFHPNENTASLVISRLDFIRFLENQGNTFEFISLYED
ncbi:MAG: prolyl-tRNA synthetase associated domain-containing protein [Cyclobacteriaceae bacterium]|nr:prolyl-tRNA synthetase associated domain-containing protein [Cyclobacteriaceae bacterium]